MTTLLLFESRIDDSKARTVAGIVLAMIVAALLLVLFAGLPDAVGSGGDAVRTETWLYRVDARDTDGNWAVYEWSVAAGPRRASEMQSRKYHCQRLSDSHSCRATVVSRFTERDPAAEQRRILCQNHRVDHGRLPAGMTSC
ncbi:hypothetical protein [Cryptosporangium sp. NPDC048952]|uniref:hypothetical protein n=1 Tax=Cryptosporangium sp. NPDC048952 TaxID=3363961 RepID=UPI003715A022